MTVAWPIPTIETIEIEIGGTHFGVGIFPKHSITTVLQKSSTPHRVGNFGKI